MSHTSGDRSKPVSRRSFHKTAAATFGAASGFHFFPALADKKLEKPTLAAIGAGGKGRADIQGAANAGFEVISLVDVVDIRKLQIPKGDKKLASRLGKLSSIRDENEGATFYRDYREMFAEQADRVDAVIVSTPDHHHFHASAMAMLGGKHVYCQKPLTHGIWEARTLADLATKTGVKTQMGNQAHANDHLRRCVELVRAGMIGKVEEIHAWTNRPIWAQGFGKPPETVPVPDAIDWDLWCGPAPFVDYSPRIAPFAWRGWWDYGTGALGDMACHIMDLGYWTMDAKHVRSVTATQNGATDLSPPINSKVNWAFGETPYSAKGGFTFHWYDGYVDATFDRSDWRLVKNSDEYNHPGPDVLGDADFSKFGCVIIGEHGKLLFNRSKNNWELESGVTIDGFDWPQPSLPRATDQDPYKEWYDAVSGKIDRAESHFGHSGPMTEMILLGVIAQRHPGQKLQWDPKKMSIKDRPELDGLIRRPYRKGWASPV